MFFISDAFADASAGQSSGIVSFLPVIAFVAILYFLLIRPQQKRQKQHQELIAAIKKGDKVVTSSGIIGTVSKIVSEHEVIIEIANGVHCKFVKSAISSVMGDSEKGSAQVTPGQVTPVQDKETAEDETPIISEPKTKNEAKKSPIRKVTSKKVESSKSSEK